LRKLIAPDPSFTVPQGSRCRGGADGVSLHAELVQAQLRLAVRHGQAAAPTVFTPPASDYNFGPPDFSGVNSSDDPLSQVCEAVAALLDWLFKSAGQVANLINDLLATVASAATWPAREAIYDGSSCRRGMSESIRLVLVHMGS